MEKAKPEIVYSIVSGMNLEYYGFRRAFRLIAMG
jgi:hypothetical protein